MLTYAIIRGHADLIKYCEKRWGEKPRFIETIGHVKECTVELHYWKSPTDDGYQDYYYGTLLTSTGKLHLFGLEYYYNGILLRIPSRENPAKLGAFIRQDKLPGHE